MALEIQIRRIWEAQTCGVLKQARHCHALLRVQTDQCNRYGKIEKYWKLDIYTHDWNSYTYASIYSMTQPISLYSSYHKVPLSQKANFISNR
jgi:hypothetical protein